MLRLRKEGAVLFVEIAVAPMNLLGLELVRDLLSLIRQTANPPGGELGHPLLFGIAEHNHLIFGLCVERESHHAGQGIPRICPQSLRHSGVYLQTVEYRYGFLVYAAGVTAKPF